MNRNGTEMEWKWNRYGMVMDHKNGKKRSLECKLQGNVFFRMHASKSLCQIVYQGFGKL